MPDISARAATICSCWLRVGVEPTTNGLTEETSRSQPCLAVRKQALRVPVARQTTPRYTPVRLAGRQVGDIPGMAMNPLIESNPIVMMGKPVIRGTRLTVEGILEKLGAGESVEQLLAAHPRLTRGGILAAIEFADYPRQS
jgi:uncharacterized protein (DUF433 family)